MLSIDDLHWSFHDGGSERAILRGLCVDFEPGRAYAVTGPSGCGKTTLLSILSLLCRPLRGRICFLGKEISALSADRAESFRREKIGLIFQSFRLIEKLTVEEQLVFAAEVRGRRHALQTGRSLVDRFGLSGALGRLPGQLSGGEKQRVAVALALMFRPALVLADEPTAALDDENTERIAGVLSDYARDEGAVVVAVSHDPALIGRFDAVLPLAEHPFASRAPWGRNDEL